MVEEGEDDKTEENEEVVVEDDDDNEEDVEEGAEGARDNYAQELIKADRKEVNLGEHGPECAHNGAIAFNSTQKRARPCAHFQRGRCRYGESCRYVHVEQPQKRQKRVAPQQEVNERRPSLLKALLAKEVRTERSLLLQCFRRLVKKLDDQGPAYR